MSSGQPTEMSRPGLQHSLLAGNRQQGPPQPTLAEVSVLKPKFSVLSFLGRDSKAPGVLFSFQLPHGRYGASGFSLLVFPEASDLPVWDPCLFPWIGPKGRSPGVSECGPWGRPCRPPGAGCVPSSHPASVPGSVFSTLHGSPSAEHSSSEPSAWLPRCSAEGAHEFRIHTIHTQYIL